jgi:hypothetical protein
MEMVTKWIAKAGRELSSALEEDPEHPNVTALRELERYCEGQFVASRNKFERFVCFMIVSFVNEIFFNLGGDTPYSIKLHEERVSLYREVAKGFTNLGAKQAKGKRVIADFVETFSGLIDSYANKIKILNDIQNC